jgi:type II secretory pathway pseudopilin PulG
MRPKRRRGMILLLVLVVVAMLALVCLGYSDLMLGERRAALTASRQSQVRTLAQSGAELVRQFLDRAPADQTTAGGLFDNSQRFSGVLIADDDTPQNRGRCSVIAPRLDGDSTVIGARYGLQDESTRINLATILQFNKKATPPATPPPPPDTNQQSTEIAKTMLMALPGMTDDVSDAILDWIDTDDTPRANGAESEYYNALSPGYTPRNGPPVTIEELLLVRGVTPELLFGRDAAVMGLVPASSAADGNIEGVDNSDGSMDHGWAAYLTLWSAELNTTKPSDGTPKINLNGSDLQKLHDDLVAAGFTEDEATFIAAYRAHGPYTGTPPSNSIITTDKLDLSKTIKAAGTKLTSLTSVLDLIGATVEIDNTELKSPAKPPPPPPKKHLKSPFATDGGTMGTYLPKLFDNTTVQSGSKPVYGRININQASRTVLMCIPGLTSDLVDQIISTRGTDPLTAPADQKYEVWPLIEGIVPLKTMKALQPYVTAGGNVYRAQIMGYFDKGGPVGRIEAIFDSTQHPTKLLFWKDISRLPGGFPVEPNAQANQPTSQPTN